MKIPLKMNGQQGSYKPAVGISERDILAVKNGDWTAKNNLFKTFQPLFLKLAERRAEEPAEIAKFIEKGKTGLLLATKKYKTSVGADRFQIFALDRTDACGPPF